MDENLCQKYRHQNKSKLSKVTIQILILTKMTKTEIQIFDVSIPLPNSENFPNMELKFSSSTLPVHVSIISVRCPALLSVNSPLEFDKKIGQLLVKYVYQSFTINEMIEEDLDILEVFELMRLSEIAELLYLTYICQVTFCDMISKGKFHC